jgi:hypothetical protein
MSKLCVILRVDFDDAEHEIYGPFDSEAEAKKVLATFAANNPEFYSTDDGKIVMSDDDEYGGPTNYLSIIYPRSPELLFKPE